MKYILNMSESFRINFKNNKNINWNKDDNGFIYFKNVNGLDCCYGFRDAEYSNMGKLVPNISDLFGVIPNEEYEAIRDKDGITIKIKNKKKKFVLIINPDNKFY